MRTIHLNKILNKPHIGKTHLMFVDDIFHRVYINVRSQIKLFIIFVEYIWT
jgi:hypothetical protein